MSSTGITWDNVLLAVTLMSVAFTVFRYFRDPQIKSDKNDDLIMQKEDLKGQEYERRFNELSKSIASNLEFALNHVHTVDTKVDNLTQVVGKLSENIVELRTIINERIPKRQ